MGPGWPEPPVFKKSQKFGFFSIFSVGKWLKKLKTTCRLQTTCLRAEFHTRLQLGILSLKEEAKEAEHRTVESTAICRASRGGECREGAKWTVGKGGGPGAGMPS